MSGSQQLILGEGAGGSGVANYIEDVFSTWLYTGTGSTQTITNGIDLSTKGGLVWLKGRSGGDSNVLYDTNRGVTSQISSNSTDAAQNQFPFELTDFNSNGFTIGSGNTVNRNGSTYASWTFREQPKFFDVVTYTGTGSLRTVAHSLGSVPGTIIVKCTSEARSWFVYHRSLGENKYLTLETTNAEATDAGSGGVWGGTAPTATEFTVGATAQTNGGSGRTYVAYLFAHNAGGFGLTGTDNVISCGSFTTDGSGYSPDVNLGYEPQWILLKPSGGTGDWLIVDTMRGWVNPAGTAADDANLRPNKSDAEALNDIGWPTATGFNAGYRGTANNQWIYIAIRRGPMKTPTTGTSVFQADTYSGTGASGRSLTTLSAIYLSIIKWRTGNPFGDGWSWSDRLRGIRQLASNSAASETNHQDHLSAFGPNQNTVTLGDGGTVNGSGMTYVNYAFQRAPGFFDVVCYTGTGSATTVTHNLGVVPELMIVKRRDGGTNSWLVYDSFNGATKRLVLNLDYASAATSDPWNDTAPTSSVFTVGISTSTNGSGSTYVAYLFASCPGVSKVGSYTGTGTTLQIDCGFTGGARFVLIKRTDSTGDWYVWDSARGIVSGNDPYLLLNSTAAEVTNTDYVDTYSAGFEISSTAPAAINANGGTFIFLAIA